MKIAIIGCGFVGLQTARLFHAAGWEVIGITHSAASAEKLTDEPFRVTVCDIAEASSLESHRELLAKPGAAIHCASSGRGGVEEYRRVYLEGMRNILRV